jgi:putative ABC transport system permease protein
MRAIARTEDGEGQALVELKAVDSLYPLVGRVEIAGGGDLATLLRRRWHPAALAEAELVTRSGIAVGDRFRLGTGTFVLRGIIESEPDRRPTASPSARG